MKVFEESQRFNQWWFIAMQVLVFVIALFSFVETYQEGALENNPDALVGLGVSFTVFLLAMILIWSMQLRTRIDEIGVHYQYFPIHWKKRLVKWSELSNCYVRKYSPLTEYGGWGIRGFSKKRIFGIGRNKGIAYNVKGNIGLQLVFKDGGKLLIGTQHPEKIKRTVTNYFKSAEVE